MVWIGPSTMHIDQALFGAMHSYGQLLTLVVKRFELDDPEGLNEEFDKLMNLFAGRRRS